MTKNCYVDASVMVAVMFDEPGSQRYRSLLGKTRTRFFSSSLLEAEVYAAAKREKIPLETAAGFIHHIALIFPDRMLQDEYFSIFRHGYVRGPDAHHLAAALYIDPSARNLAFMTADHRQAELASAVGFRVIQ